MKNETKSENTNFVEIGVLAGIIIEFLVALFNPAQVKYWLGHKTELKKRLREVFSMIDEYTTVREEWASFYKKHFDWDVNFSQIVIPERPKVGKWRLLFIPKGMTMNISFSIASKLFKTWRYFDDLDSSVTKNCRTASEHYAVWVRDAVEPDTETLGQSTRKTDSDMKIGITLLERIIFEIKYFSETEKHLDIKGLTFCSGSRISDGDVPYADWSNGLELGVGRIELDHYNSGYGIRSAVSL